MTLLLPFWETQVDGRCTCPGLWSFTVPRGERGNVLYSTVPFSAYVFNTFILFYLFIFPFFEKKENPPGPVSRDKRNH